MKKILQTKYVLLVLIIVIIIITMIVGVRHLLLSQSAESGKSQTVAEGITEVEAMTIAYDEAKKTIPEPLIQRINSADTGGDPTVKSGTDGKRNFWYVTIGDQKGQYIATYTLEGRKIADIQARKMPDEQLSGTVHFGKGTFSISDIKIDSDQAVKIAMDEKGLKPGNPDNPDDWLIGYHFMTGEVAYGDGPNDQKVVTTVYGIAPGGARANVNIDPATGKILSAVELTGYDQDGKSEWKAF